MKLAIVAFVLGAILLQQQAELPGGWWGWAWLLSALLCAGLLRIAPDRIRFARIALWCFFVLTGFLWAAMHAHWRLADELPPDWQRRDIQISGVVASIPQRTDRGIRFHMDVERVNTDGAIVPKRIAVSWYVERATENRPSALPTVHAGERWQLTVRLRQPRGNANPHGFDYEVWALERNIRATGYVRPSLDNRRLDAAVNRPAYWIERLRERIQRQFSANLPDYAYTGVLQALATGDQQAIARDQWQTFTRTGTNHLMAISGLHITMTASLAFALMYGLWRRSAFLSLRLPARRAAAAAGLIAALGYAVLSGFAIPAQRAFYMLAVVAIALWHGRRTSASTVLAWALLAVVLIDPWAVIAPGFWLSFGAIAVIMLITAGRTGKTHGLSGWLRVQWAITLGLIPLLLALFQQVSLVSPLANAIAIPAVSLVVVPLTLLAAIPFFDIVLPLAHEAIGIVMTVLQQLSDSPHAVWQQHAPPLWTILAALAGIVWMLLPGGLGIGFFSGFPARWLGLAAMLPMFLVLPPRPDAGELWLTVLDVGQGLAVVAQTKHHALLFDTGPAFGETDSGSRIIVPFLRGEGIRHIDRMIVSHADSDHSGGALSVLQAVTVEQLLSSLDERHAIPQAIAGRQKCHAGQQWTWDGVQFEMLHPLPDDYSYPRRQPNVNNCVLKITTAHGSVLLPADIEAKDEQALLARDPDKLRATVLIAPHHGSRTSSTDAFVQAANPAWVIFTVGYLNRYNHPNAAVTARYRGQNSRLLHSDSDGAIAVRFADNTVIVERWRRLYRRYWRQ